MEDIDLWEADILAGVAFEVDYFGRFVDTRMGGSLEIWNLPDRSKQQVLDTGQRGR
jgi:hypothetical protein